MSGAARSDDDLPSAKECDALCSQFSEITQANSAEAQMYLQEHAWNLERSVQAFYAENDDTSEPSAKIAKVDVMAAATSGDADRIRVLSWNLDGLDDVSLLTRTKAAVQVIKKEDPDVVFLQEIVAHSWKVIQDEMGVVYRLIPADIDAQYFTVILLKRSTVLLDSQKVRPFFTSMMMRKLQILEVNIKGIDVKLMTSHLESTAQHSVERVRQLKICFDEMTSTHSKRHVIFGGDLNLGTKDFNTISVPSGVVDVWEKLGSKNETRYTWDTRYNDNKQMRGGGQPRCRFDRFYFRQSESKNVSPSRFQLVGLERVKDCSRFPSDHWGILCQFHIAHES